MFFKIITFQPLNFTYLHVYGCKTYIQINMLPKKQIFTKKTYIGYFIEYNLFNIYKIWNANKNKIIKIKNIILNKNFCCDFIDIDLNQLINELFIEIDLFKLIQSNSIKIIKINLNKELKFNPYLPTLKSHSNIEFSNQTTLHVPDFNIQTLTPIPNTLFKSKSNIITFISSN